MYLPVLSYLQVAVRESKSDTQTFSKKKSWSGKEVAISQFSAAVIVHVIKILSILNYRGHYQWYVLGITTLVTFS